MEFTNSIATEATNILTGTISDKYNNLPTTKKQIIIASTIATFVIGTLIASATN